MKRSHEDGHPPEDRALPADECEKRQRLPHAELNPDCLERVFSHLDYLDLVRVSRTSKMWNGLANYAMGHLTKFVLWDSPSVYDPHGKPKTDAQFCDLFSRTNLSELDISSKPGKANMLLLKGIKTHCRNLKKFKAAGVIFKRKLAMSFFVGIPNVTHLDLSNCEVTEPILKNILTRCPSLTWLNVSNNKFNGAENLNQVTPNSNMKYLNISNNGPMVCMDRHFEDLKLIFPQLEELDISFQKVHPFFEHIFRVALPDQPQPDVDLVVYRQWAERKKKKDEMLCLKKLKVQNIGVKGSWLSLNMLPAHHMVFPIYNRLPNLEELDLTDNVLDIMFLLHLKDYCPKLTSLDLSGCAINFDDLTQFNNTDFSLKRKNTVFYLIFESLPELTKLRFNCVTRHSLTQEDHRLHDMWNLDWRLEDIVGTIGGYFENLEVLELAEYPGLKNKAVARLIIHLTWLKELRIQLCGGVDNDLFRLLMADPWFYQRTQKLVLFVHRTGIGNGYSIPESVAVPDMIELDFGLHNLFEDYQCPYVDERILKYQPGDQKVILLLYVNSPAACVQSMNGLEKNSKVKETPELVKHVSEFHVYAENLACDLK